MYKKRTIEKSIPGLETLVSGGIQANITHVVDTIKRQVSSGALDKGDTMYWDAVNIPLTIDFMTNHFMDKAEKRFVNRADELVDNDDAIEAMAYDEMLSMGHII